ncbi:histidine phosphatase superfamily [Amylocarpus encephaloides]|uniref:Histidine phosphatase superfamily n=1 Tax=Amylocarpus encephaloides TaxID=45428 RepID=A0A9P7Y8S6_9HELO|nr:histidine phosphatase superfamily [Amylocarpus encephaloides]
MARPNISITCLIPVFFLATVIVAVLIMIGEAPSPAPEMESESTYTKYTTVTGYFQQDDPATEDKNFDYTTSNFGLINKSYDGDSDSKTQWEKFGVEVARLNEQARDGTQYKVLYMGRHGEGYHNVAEAFYGKRDWDCYWSLQDGNETSTWVDALLTPTGISQAQEANDFWRRLIVTEKIQTPQSYYTSPLLRCMATANVTFSGLPLPSDRPFVPLVNELIRECIGAHTCDRRSSKTIIQKNYPDWPFSEGFSEEDPLWDAELRETGEAMDRRLRRAVDEIFGSDKNTWISISSHSGAIASILRVLGHQTFSLGTGQVIPVLVKAEKVAGEGPPREKGPYTRVSTCAAPPPTLSP